MRCATARPVSWSLVVQGHAGEVTLELIDDGQGLPPEGSQGNGHYGLRWLAERVQGLGGRFEIAPASPRGGVRLQVRLPLAATVEAP